MNRLENQIRENREAFNDSLPPDGHFERFKNKMSPQKTVHFNFLRIASVLILGLLVTAIGIYSIRSFSTSKTMYASQEDDINETLYYYSGINIELEEKVYEMEFEDENDKEDLLKDLKLYDEGLDKIEEDLEKFPNDERVRNAAISHHRGKTALLNIIISQ